MDGMARFQPANRADWRKWLRANHAKSTGVWMVFLKGKERQITYEEAVEEALCYGWIDSLMRSVDDRSYIQLFTPRKPKSNWSALNKKRVESLIKRKLMAAPGRAKIEAAKKNGTWTALDHVEALTIPPDLQRALAANRKAKTFFEGCPPSSRKGMLRYVTGVKSPVLRASRVEQVISQCAKRIDMTRLAMSTKKKP
jgi:uncharacterized protein YdeI (YjbR/CyaY-like superfamily)